MTNKIQAIPIRKLVAHPDNPNRMSKKNFARLVRNIERSGRYEPLVVRPKGNLFQIINGHHRWQALQKLGHETADAVVWNIGDEDADILLATLNRLGGSDVLEKKLALLSRLNERMRARDLARLLPQSAKQIERLNSMFDARVPMPPKHKSVAFANPLVFFLSDAQQQIVERAMSLASSNLNEKAKAAKNAAALTCIAQQYLAAQSAGDSKPAADGKGLQKNES